MTHPCKFCCSTHTGELTLNAPSALTFNLKDGEQVRILVCCVECGKISVYTNKELNAYGFPIKSELEEKKEV